MVLRFVFFCFSVGVWPVFICFLCVLCLSHLILYVHVFFSYLFCLSPPPRHV